MECVPQNKPEIEDAVVWSSVYPLFAEKDKVSANFGGLVSWYAAVEESGLSKVGLLERYYKLLSKYYKESGNFVSGGCKFVATTKWKRRWKANHDL